MYYGLGLVGDNKIKKGATCLRSYFLSLKVATDLIQCYFYSLLLPTSTIKLIANNYISIKRAHRLKYNI